MNLAPIRQRGARRLSAALVAALLFAVAGLASPAGADDDDAVLPAPDCPVDVTYFEYVKEIEPAKDAVYEDRYQFSRTYWVQTGRWFWEGHWKTEYHTASIPTGSLREAVRALIDLLISDGWVLSSPFPVTVEVSEATEAVYATQWSPTSPGDDWEATDESEVRSETAPCPPCTEGVGFEPDCKPECVWVDGIASDDPKCINPTPVVPTPVVPTPPVDTTPTTDPTPDVDEPVAPEEPQIPEPEVGGITETTEDSDQLSGGAEAVAAGGAQLPRTGGESGTLLLVAGMLTFLGLALLTARRRLT